MKLCWCLILLILFYFSLELEGSLSQEKSHYNLAGSPNSRARPKCKRPMGKIGATRSKGCSIFTCKRVRNRKANWIETSCVAVCPTPAATTPCSCLTAATPTTITTAATPTTTTTAATPTTTTTAPNPTPDQGVLITGATTTEVYLPSTNTSCLLGDLPDYRELHTQTTMADNSVVICGGMYTRKSCLKFSPNSSSNAWTDYATMIYGRFSSTSWLSSEGLIIIAGNPSFTTTEKVPGGGLQFSVGGGGKKYEAACAIADQNTDSVILTGGWLTPENVDRYNLQGHMERLPNIHGRYRHACGSFMSGGNMVLLVSGGWTSSDALTSTQKLVIGQSAWSKTARLPRALYYMPSISFDNQVMIFGGWDRANGLARTEILTFNAETSTWTVTGHMKKPRYDHAVSLVTVPANICG